MAEDKKSFLMYADTLAMVSKLPDDLAGKLLKLILEYVNDKNPETNDLTLQIAFEPIKQQLKRDLKKYETIKGFRSKIGTEGGKKSGEVRRKQKEANEAKGSFNEANEAVNDSVNVNVSVTDSVINFKKGFFLNGVVIEKTVSEYFKEKFSAFREQWVMKNGIEIESKVYEKMDSDYLAYSFTDLNHLQNTFKSVWKKVSEQKPEKNNSPQGTLNAYQEARQKLGLNG